MGMLLRRHKNKVAQEELKQVPDEIKEEKKASKTKNKKTSDKG